MFKRFLKFLKGDESEQLDERFEGSYLDHLLEQVRPAVERHLEDCPGHDPVLLVVVEVLRTTMPNAWAPGLRQPLIDSATPGVTPPPPPSSVGDASQADATNELEIADAGLAYDDTESSDEFLVPSDLDVETEFFPEADVEPNSTGTDAGKDDSEDEDSQEVDDEDDADDQEREKTDGDEERAEETIDNDEEDKREDTGDEDDDETAEEEQIEDDDDTDERDPPDHVTSESEGDNSEDETKGDDGETEDAVALDAGDVIAEAEVAVDESDEEANWSRITEEINVAEIKAAAGKEDTQEITVEVDRNLVEKVAELPRVDNEEVLQAGRVFFKLLLENDRLPTDLQFSVGETMLARDLLLGYFVGDEGFETKAKRLLSMVETKFGEGLFSQAKILLELFQTDESTRINNDRNLFYEDMILRLGIRRRSPLSDEQTAQFSELTRTVEDDESLRELVAWLDEECLIKFRVHLRDPNAVEAWHAVADQSERLAAANLFKAFMPPSRWRAVDVFPEISVEEQIKSHINSETAEMYVISQLKTCYFILRAVGDTGLEVFLDNFFDWTERTFDINATVLMPQLYNRSMMDTDSMDNILAALYREHFELKVLKIIEDLDDEKLSEAFEDAIEQFTASNLGEIAPGYYDLGGFVFDQIFDMPYPDDEFASKIHRLT